jgi:DNA-binding winged helix-turn-helix (wHTH) protein
VQYVFGAFCLDLDRQGLFQDDTLAPLEPKLYAVLIYLVQHRDRLVSRDELLEQVWGEFYGDTSVISRSIGMLRRILGDDRTSQRVIQTRRGWGYQFVAAVVEISESASPSSHASTETLIPPVGSPVSPEQVCPVCQVAQTTPGRLCAACGAAMQARCATCGQALPEQAAFCPACGHRREDVSAITAASRQADSSSPSVAALAERKPVSVRCAVWDAELTRHWELDDLPEHLEAVAS